MATKTIFTRTKMQGIQAKYPHVKTESDVHALSDEQLLKCANIGKMFLYYLRAQTPRTPNQAWNDIIDEAIQAVTRKLNSLKK